MYPFTSPMMMSGRKVGASPAKYIGSGFSTSTGTVTIAKPVGTLEGDYIMIYCPYGGSAITGGSGAATWSKDTFTNDHGYDNWVYHKPLSASDMTATIQITGVSYAPVTWVVYRGPKFALKISESTNSTATSHPMMHPRGKSAACMGWVSWVNDRNGNSDAVAPLGWTKRIGPNATGVFTGEIADNLVLDTLPVTAGTVTWPSGFTQTSGYFHSGYMFELVNWAVQDLSNLFWQPKVLSRSYVPDNQPVVGTTTFSQVTNNVGWMGDSAPYGTTAIYEVDVSSATAGWVIGAGTIEWMNAWKAAYPSSVPGIGGGIFWTATKGAGYWYGGGTHQLGGETSTVSDPQNAIVTLGTPAVGNVIGIVINGRRIQCYLNGVSKGGVLLHKDGGAANTMGGTMLYPFIGVWGSTVAGSFRSTPSAFFSSYKLTLGV